MQFDIMRPDTGSGNKTNPPLLILSTFTYNKLLTHCKILETWHEQYQKAKEKGWAELMTITVPTATSSIHQNAINTKHKWKRCGYNHIQGSGPAYGKVCYNCSRKDHFTSLLGDLTYSTPGNNATPNSSRQSQTHQERHRSQSWDRRSSSRDIRYFEHDSNTHKDPQAAEALHLLTQQPR